MDDEWETSVISQGVTIDTPELENIISLETARLRQLAIAEPNEEPDLTRSPPNMTGAMFPGLLKKVVDKCCAGCEAVPVAVAINVLLRLAALIGQHLYIPIGDERRWMNEFILMVGPTGLGKGSSNHGPKRLFQRVEEFLELDLNNQFQAGTSEGISQYSNLMSHTGGLSSGEGLAAAMNDGAEIESQPVTDKRMLIFEPEFSNLMSMSQRTGNILSMVLRNAFDGNDIQPMTKRDKVRVTRPYLCLMAHITASELNSHEQSKIMTQNGLLNRFLILWQQPNKVVAFPKPIPEYTVDQLAAELSEIILFARGGSHETHYKKIPEQAQSLSFDKDAILYWENHYYRLLNRADCEQVMALTRRHRLHAIILSGLFALMDKRLVITQADLESALAWCEYSRQSVVYIFGSLVEQRKAANTHILAKAVFQAIRETQRKKQHCTASDLYQWFSRKIKREQLTQALEYLLNHIPPLIRQETKIKGRGRPTLLYFLTENSTHLGEQ